MNVIGFPVASTQEGVTVGAEVGSGTYMELHQSTRVGTALQGASTLSADEAAILEAQLVARQAAMEAEMAALEAEIAESTALLGAEEAAELVEAGVPVVGWIAAAFTAALVATTIAAIIMATVKLNQLKVEAAAFPKNPTKDDGVVVPVSKPQEPIIVETGNPIMIGPSPTLLTIGPGVLKPLISYPRRKFRRYNTEGIMISVPFIG